MTTETPFVKTQPEGEPPSYTTIEANRPKDAPPSYYDVMGLSQIKQEIGAAKDESSNPAVVMFRLCCICVGSLIYTAIIFVLCGVLPISLLVVGAVHLDDCNLNDKIPIWMVVYGSVSLAFTLISIFKSIFCPNKKRQERESSVTENKPSPINSCANSIEGLFQFFLFVWLIIGSVWVLGNYKDWNDADRPTCDGLKSGDANYDNCCHKGMFLFAFIFIIVMWSLAFLLICCACSCICLLLACVAKGSGEQES